MLFPLNDNGHRLVHKGNATVVLYLVYNKKPVNISMSSVKGTKPAE